MIIKNCKYCNKEFSPIRKSTAIYCSSKCNLKVYYNNHKQKFIEKANEWRLANPERRKAIVSKNNKKTYRKKIEENPNYNSEEYLKRKESYNSYAKRYRKNNKEFIRALNNERRAYKLKAIPKWADKSLIKEFYKKTPEGYQVDHIYPLKSNWVCGLHVIDNLQYLTASENFKKNNKKDIRYHKEIF